MALTKVGGNIIQDNVTIVGVLTATKLSAPIIQDNVTIVGVLTATKLSAPNMTIGTGSTSSFTADVSGDMRIQDGYKMRFGGASVSSNYYIQYNSTTNSLDFVSG